MKNLENKLIVAIMTLALSATAWGVPIKSGEQELSRQQLVKRIRKELVTLPYYGVFDNLAYQVEGGKVTLHGQVVQAILRRNAERRIAKLPGVEEVVNNIEVLPLSNFDDSLRVRTYRAVFRAGSLYRYALGANPSIHIIVNRGHLTLEGVVANEMDRQLAHAAARSVPGAFSVTNNLRSESGEERAR